MKTTILTIILCGFYLINLAQTPDFSNTQIVNGLESTNRLAVSITLNTVPAAPSTIAGALDFCYSYAPVCVWYPLVI